MLQTACTHAITRRAAGGAVVTALYECKERFASLRVTCHISGSGLACFGLCVALASLFWSVYCPCKPPRSREAAVPPARSCLIVLSEQAYQGVWMSVLIGTICSSCGVGCCVWVWHTARVFMWANTAAAVDWKVWVSSELQTCNLSTLHLLDMAMYCVEQALTGGLSRCRAVSD